MLHSYINTRFLFWFYFPCSLLATPHLYFLHFEPFVSVSICCHISVELYYKIHSISTESKPIKFLTYCWRNIPCIIMYYPLSFQNSNKLLRGWQTDTLDFNSICVLPVVDIPCFTQLFVFLVTNHHD